MSTNLRLGEEMAAALREAAARSGRSQQQIVRDALARELGLETAPTALEQAVRDGVVDPPEPFRDVAPRLRLRRGMSTHNLLARDDR